MNAMIEMERMSVLFGRLHESHGNEQKQPITDDRMSESTWFRNSSFDLFRPRC